MIADILTQLMFFYFKKELETLKKLFYLINTCKKDMTSKDELRYPVSKSINFFYGIRNSKRAR